MDSDNDDSLTKPKSKRSAKQIEAFEKAKQARQAYLEEKKMKEDETKKKRDTLKEIKNELNGKPKTESSNNRGKPKIKEEPIVDNKHYSKSKKQPIYESDCDSVNESEEETEDEVVEEEIIIMKKPKKKPVQKKKKIVRKVIMQESSDEEEEEEDEEPEPPKPKPIPTSRNTKTQQNARSKIVANPVQSVSNMYYFMD